jgi:hypothetical protein
MTIAHFKIAHDFIHIPPVIQTRTMARTFVDVVVTILILRLSRW